jgi:hypothetical protein
MSALLSFLGGSAFRLVWSWVAEYLNKRQDHKNEMAALELQAKLDSQRHTNDCERLRLQSDLGVKEIQVQADADVQKLEASAFVEAMRNANKPTGIGWVDAWNGIIRPLVATIAVLLWVMALDQQGWMLSEWDKELIAVAIGFFFASRELAKGRK